MSRQTWQMQVVGSVSRRGADGILVAVPRGEYTMSRLNTEIYELSGAGAPTFGLTRREVQRYIEAKGLRSLSRPWP